MNLVIDASVACKWYLDEALSEQAQALMQSDDMFVAPDLIVAEVGNVAWQRARHGDSKRQASEIVEHLPNVFLALVPAAELMPRALEIAGELDHPLYDCLYLPQANAGIPRGDRRSAIARQSRGISVAGPRAGSRQSLSCQMTSGRPTVELRT